MLLSIAYFPPISWFSAVARAGTLLDDDRVLCLEAAERACVQLESCENYQRQSWRNRCRILSARGPEDLTVPIVHGRLGPPIREALIDYSTPWPLRTKKTIMSAYGNAAFFIHYSGDIFAILDSSPATLWELDVTLIEYLKGKLGIEVDFSPTTEYISSDAPLQTASHDLRDTIHPKRPDPLTNGNAYFQVFSVKYGFVPNLSVLDLLFNMGPDSRDYLLSTKQPVRQ